MKPRNMIAVHAWKRKSGAHGSTTKAIRRKEKVQVQTQVQTQLRELEKNNTGV